jgi:hypothetical protein
LGLTPSKAHTRDNKNSIQSMIEMRYTFNIRAIGSNSKKQNRPDSVRARRNSVCAGRQGALRLTQRYLVSASVEGVARTQFARLEEPEMPAVACDDNGVAS